MSMTCSTCMWKKLKQVLAGEHSRVINIAIFDWLKTWRRTSVVSKMDTLRARMPTVSAQEIADWLRLDRELRRF